MKKTLSLVLVTVIMVISFVLTGCATGGVPRTQYNELASELADTQSMLAQTKTDLIKAQADKAALEVQVKDIQTKLTSLQNKYNSLQEVTSLTGDTAAETAEKIVKHYDETHIYSTTDYFVCSDMASEVWNMLKKQGISSVIVVGRKDAIINDILLSNHAWVLADIGNGEKLALETTGGHSVLKSDNPYYYMGWAFSSPADLKSHNDMVKEYNTRVAFRNQLNSEANEAADASNEVLYNKLVELRTEQETILNNLKSKIDSLVIRIN